MSQVRPLYSPALRLKEGEANGLGGLAPDIADRVLPRMIVPPPEERDEKQLSLITGTSVPDITALAPHWRHRDVLIDTTHIMDEFGRDRLRDWLPGLFDRARNAGIFATPTVALSDLLSPHADVYRSVINQSSRFPFAIVLSSGELATNQSLLQALEVLRRLGIEPGLCTLIADFHDSDFSNPDIVAPIIGGVMETCQATAPWQQIVFQGTNYPEKNPAEPGAQTKVLRNEWLAWRRAVKFDPQTAEHMIFGDYAADCAKMKFGGSGGIAICHYRYATPDAWLVQRGAKGEKHAQAMRSIATGIVKSGTFAGAEFSSADKTIKLISEGRAGPGNASDWRAINTTHHITRVVTDMGQVKGVKFKQGEAVPEQELLL